MKVTSRTMFSFLHRAFLLLSVVAFSSSIIGTFSSVSITLSVHAATPLTASANNPYRTKLATGYVERVDRVVTNILSRGSDLSEAQYLTYLTTISNGIKTMGQKPVYAGNPDVVNVIGYLQYEIDDIKSRLSNGNLFMDDLLNMIEASVSGTASGNTGSNTSTTTGNTTTGNNAATTASAACSDGMACSTR